MGKRAKSEKFKIKKEALDIECSWQNCSVVCKSIQQLNGHITEHLNKFCNDKTNDDFSCIWGACPFKTKCWNELQRHAYYHGYYSGLATRGRFEVESDGNVPECTLEKEDIANNFPDLKMDFKCWFGDCVEGTFLSIVDFQEHVFKHANFEYETQKSHLKKAPNIRCNWQYCNLLLPNKYRFIEHVGKHCSKKEVACHCCRELFRRKLYLFDHCRRQAANNIQKHHQCAQCSKFFATEKLLRYHVLRHINCFKCSMCDMTCPSSSSLATHIRYRHINERPFGCPECDYRCVTKYDLNKHKSVHTKAFVHRCAGQGCNYAVRTYNLLRRHHQEVHNDRPIIYVCHFCEKLFKNSKNLSYHLMKKHDLQLPSGHKRFTYKLDEDGCYRLETMRMESLEVTKQILSPNSFIISEVDAKNNCLEIVTNNLEDNGRGHITVKWT